MAKENLERTSDLLLRQLLDGAEDTAMAIIDTGYRLTWMNRTAERFFQCSADALLGQSIRDIHIRNRVAEERFEEALACISRGESFEYRIERREDGKVRHLGMRLSGLWHAGRLAGYLLLARDITERYRSELQTRREGEHYRNLYEHAPVPYHSLDSRGCIRHVNPAWLESLGYREEQVIGRPIQEFLEAGEAQRFTEAFERFKQNGKLCDLEVTLRRSDGRPVVASLTGCAIYDEHDRFHHSHCILVDITEQKAALQALKESEERFAHFMDNLPAAAFILDGDGNLVYANRYLEARFGGRRHGDRPAALPPEFRPRPEAADNRQQLVRVRHGDGAERIYEVFRFSIAGEGGPPRLFGGIAIDVTEKERNRRDLELFRFALEKSGDAVYWLTPDARLLYANEAACRQLGYRREELLQMHVWDIDPNVDPDACREVWENLKEKGTVRMESVHRRKDGSEFPVEITANHLVHGEEEFNCAVVRDVSEQRRVQKELQQAHKMEALGQLTGGIAHDFNNILASILGFSELSLMQLDAGRTGNLRRHLEEINTAGKRGKELIDQMLRFTRHDGQERRPLRLQPLVKEITRMASSILPSSIVIDTVIDDGAPSIEADPVQIHQALMNLCINARDAMENKGLLQIRLEFLRDLEFECASCHARLRGDWVELRVVDDGHGIPESIREQIFDAFFTTKSPGKGTGMGLAVVREAVHQNLGHILVESTEGKGACFRLLFPPATEEAGEQEPDADAPVPAVAEKLQGTLALVVDDEPAVLAVMCAMLEHQGLRTIGFHDSGEALGRFLKAPGDFSLALVDQTMPGMTGVEFIQRLRQSRPDLPVILCTGFSDSVNEEGATRLGIDIFLRKPVDLETLRQALLRLS